MSSKVLVIDVGGTNIKILASGQAEPRRLRSGPTMTAAAMADGVKKLAEGWAYVNNVNGKIEGTDKAEMRREQIMMDAEGGMFNSAAQVGKDTIYWNGL